MPLHPDPKDDPETCDRPPLAELLAKSGDDDFLRAVAEAVLQIIMEADVEGVIGAGRHERSGDRTTWRSGHRDRTLETRLGPLNLRVPKLRTGSHFPGFLEPRKPVEKALVALAIVFGPMADEARSRRRGSLGCPPARSTTWCRRWAEPAKVPAMRSIVGMAAQG